MKKFILFNLILLCSLYVQGQSQLLEQYRAMALDYSHDLHAAEKNIAASMEVERSARADLKPKLSADANFQYTGNPMELNIDLPSMSAPLTFQGRDLKYGASLTLLQPVYTGGQLLESIRLARHRQSLANGQADVLRSSVCYQTDIQYWNTVARKEIVGVTADFRESVASLAQTIRERVDAGLADPQDLLMAEVRLNDADYQLLQAQNSFETGRMALNSLIGVALEAPTETDTTIPQVKWASDSLLAADGSFHPELRMAHDQIRIAESSLKLNDARFKPKFYVGLDGSYSSPGYNFKSDLDPNYAVYAKLSVPLFEWGKRRNEKRASKLRIGMANDNLNRVQDDIRLEVQTARVSLIQALERVRLSESSLEKAKENEQKALERYTEGRISIVEVIDAQTYRQTSQVNYVQARAAAQIQYSALLKATNRYNMASR